MQLTRSPISIGTIGIDIFKNKVLIIDYPNQQLCILEDVPKDFSAKMIDIELDKNNRPLLPLKINNKTFKILFDTGASVFPLLVPEENINIFSSNPIQDSLKVRSWGNFHYVKGRKISEKFILAGIEFKNKMIYSSTGKGIDKNSDGVTGNILFLDKIVILDLKNKKFGIK